MTTKAKLINISIVENRGRVYASSEDMPGLYVSGYTKEQVIQGLPAAIKALYAAEGIDVIVRELESDEVQMTAPWVAVPLSDAA